MADTGSSPRYVVGIDLGTTHCVLASSSLERPAVRALEIPQLVGPGEVAGLPLLPSFLYLPATGELPAGGLNLPWGTADDVVGELARRMGAMTPGRLVASAKSWICHGGVNRRAPILPWSAPDSEPHVSPFDASVRYLAHLRSAWERAHPDAPLVEQDVVVTVPASFDDGARELTVEAAAKAGLGTVRLVEEPQAAFYDFRGEHGDDLADILGDARLILVVDVGGGTTDLTLLEVLPPEGPSSGTPRFERIAVGGHLVLGGDNMDAALAHHLLAEAGITERLDPTEWSRLVQAARDAKEKLLSDGAPEQIVVSVQRRGSRLIGGTRSVTLTREDAHRVLLDGFLPLTGPDEVTTRSSRAGLTTLGLPYVTDPAIGRHVCTFLRQHVQAAREAGASIVEGLPRPDALLLNGGVFNAPAMVDRLSEVFASWFGEPVPLLRHTSLDTAVGRGAVRYGLARRGIGEVITGGTARAYYIGVAGPAGERRAYCVAPRGLDEGATVSVTERVLELVLDQRVAFPLFEYTGDRVDPAGTLVDVTDDLEPLPPLEAVMRSKGQTLRTAASGGVPVTVSATLGESGALELYLVTVELPPRRWRLEFSLAPDDAEPERPPEESEAPEKLPEKTGDARKQLERAFAGDSDATRVKGVRAEVETLLGPRGQWSGAVCRALWDACMARRRARSVSPIHELNWLRMSGWCLRPGFGMRGDRDRTCTLWEVHEEGVLHPSKANWPEWWIMWRRVAAGLTPEQQRALFAEIRPWVEPEAAPPQGPRVRGTVEMMQLLSVLEHLSPADKEQVGAWLLAATDKLGWIPVGRIGTREPFHGDRRNVVSRQVAERWLAEVMQLDWASADGAPFAATLLARVTGDPERDVAAATRHEVAERLAAAKAPSIWIDMVTRTTEMSAGDSKKVWGDALPAGLRLT